jgi:hypothetical protein
MCNFNRNINLYIFNCSTNRIESTNLSLHFDEILEPEKMEFSNELTLNFVNENMFVPLKPGKENNAVFYFGLFDSKNFMHLINIVNFNHLILYERSYQSKLKANQIIPNESSEDSDQSSRSGRSDSEEIEIHSEENNLNECINKLTISKKFFKNDDD